ncbi:MAG: hypothetical protein HY561_05835 [Gemmatimonadetes bacterium]|nr:hypothetical protein [Gemmatimonadota bacterium]
MDFLTGFLVWFGIALVAGMLVRSAVVAAGATVPMTFVFAILGAFIGGMLGMSPYIYHDPLPLRPGGLIGASAGSLFFALLYHFTARKLV